MLSNWNSFVISNVKITDECINLIVCCGNVHPKAALYMQENFGCDVSKWHINDYSEGYQSPFVFACKSGDISKIQFLQKHGFDLEKYVDENLINELSNEQLSAENVEYLKE